MSVTSTYFSVIALFITFRETIEAAIVVAVLLQFMNRSYPALKKQVWVGAASGIAVSIFFGVIFAVVYYVARDQLFAGDDKFLFVGVISWIAAALITLLAFAVLRFMNLETKLRRKMAAALKDVDVGAAAAAVDNPFAGRKNRWAIFTLAFLSVFREGVETVVFIAGVGSNTEATAIPIPALLGIAIGVGFGAFVFYSGKTVKDLRWFFYASAAVILFVGAGQVSIGTHNFQRAERFGKFNTFYSRRPWYNRPIWDISACCSDLDSGNAFFALFRALFGYQDKPTPLEVMLYLSYWVVVAGMFVYKAKRGSLLDADHKFKRRMRASGLDP